MDNDPEFWDTLAAGVDDRQRNFLSEEDVLKMDIDAQALYADRVCKKYNRSDEFLIKMWAGLQPVLSAPADHLPAFNATSWGNLAFLTLRAPTLDWRRRWAAARDALLEERRAASPPGRD